MTGFYCHLSSEIRQMSSSSTSIDIEHLFKELSKEVPHTMQTTLREEMCIYHVPVHIRQVNEDAYTPQVICIGPIHQKNENQFMKDLKRRYFKQFLNRLPNVKGEQFQKELLSTIKDCEVEIRNCYEDDSFELCKDPKEFLKMIQWDVVFILELFLKTREFKEDSEDMSQDKYKYDCIIGKPWLRAAVQRDLILLENQLPFWILDKLYKIATKYIKPDCSSFLNLTSDYFEEYNKKKINPPYILHFTYLVRLFLSSKHPTTIYTTPIIDCKTATRLEEAGMKFKPMPNECLLDIKAWTGGPGCNSIKKGELHVPTLEIDYHTECVLRNLMALEQCHFPKESFICQYVKFLDLLVDNDKDADLLIKSKVIINRLGESAAVANLINDLCKGIVEVSSCYNSLAKKLNDYSDSCCNKRKAFLRRQYFRNVWIGTGTVVGLFVLFITLQNFVRSFL
jgi:hypothetical protein